jgi:hypothetical protein
MTPPTDTALRQEILNCLRANNVYNVDEIWFRLIFLDRAGLVSLAQELHIRTS